eukprot:scaffold104685_cov33-Tisochrysis_lutea.AAC.4
MRTGSWSKRSSMDGCSKATGYSEKASEGVGGGVMYCAYETCWPLTCTTGGRAGSGDIMTDAAGPGATPSCWL